MGSPPGTKGVNENQSLFSFSQGITKTKNYGEFITSKEIYDYRNILVKKNNNELLEKKMHMQGVNHSYTKSS